MAPPIITGKKKQAYFAIHFLQLEPLCTIVRRESYAIIGEFSTVPVNPFKTVHSASKIPDHAQRILTVDNVPLHPPFLAFFALLPLFFSLFLL